MFVNQYLGTAWDWSVYTGDLGVRLKVLLTEQSYDTKISTLQWELYGIVKPGATTGSGTLDLIKIVANERTIINKTTDTTVKQGEEVLIGSGTVEVPHTTESGSGRCDFTFTLRDATAATLTDYRSLVCKDIESKAFIRADFSQTFLETESTIFPVIIPRAENVAQVVVQIPCIMEDGTTGILWEDAIVVEQEGLHEFVVEFSAEQRALLYKNLGNVFFHSNFYGLDERTSFPTYFRIYTYAIGVDTPMADTSSYTNVPICIGISDSAPVFSPTIFDVNERTIAATGNARVLVKYASTAEVTVNAEAVKGATLVSYRVENASRAFANTNVVQFERVESGAFRFYATDSREQTGTKLVNVPFVEYLPLTCRIQSNVPTGEGNLTLVVKGDFWEGDFGAVTNSVKVYYRYRKQNEETWTEWTALSDIAIDSDLRTYTASGLITGLDYLSPYVFQAYAEDAVLTIYSADRVIATTPVFDWSKNDFNFNVPVSIMGKTIGGANTLLWQGSKVMTAADSIDLAEPISAQMHGIVLVFSGASGDVSWSTHFVPKMMVELNQGGGQTFLMAINAGLSTFGAKYLYLYDDYIVGQDTNDDTATGGSNIIFKNADYVLRYVIGV